jgi:taurine dioxygenase
MAIAITPMSDVLGAEIGGVDLTRPLDDGTVAAIRRAWLDHLVVVLRGQVLSQVDQERFCQAFGEFERVKSGRAKDADNPHVMYVSNVRDEGLTTTLEDGEMWFHSDQCYFERPVSATTLYAEEVPSRGGNTRFANCYAAYEALPDDIRRRVDGRRALNAYDYGDQMLVKGGPRPADAPRYVHPVIRTHPETGRKAIYVNRLMTEHIVDMDKGESDEILEILYDHVERPDFVHEHVWRPSDLLMWDNRCTLHARTDFDPNQRRKLRRMTIKGDRPV